MMFIQCSIRDEILRIETSTALIIVIELLSAMKMKVKVNSVQRTFPPKQSDTANFPAKPM